MSNREFSVCQFFNDGTSEYVRRFVTDEEAVHAAQFYTTNVAARIGMTNRVVITDGEDSTVLDWRRGQGIVFPPEARGRV